MTDPVRDELEIRNLLARLAMLADEGNIDEYSKLWCEDAQWVMNIPLPDSNRPVRSKFGREAIVAGAKKRIADGWQGPDSHRRHVILTTAVTLRDAVASARSYFALYANTNTAPVISIFGTYNDEFRRTAEGWKLSSRTVDA